MGHHIEKKCIQVPIAEGVLSLMEKSFVLYGAGVRAEKFFYREMIDPKRIEFCIDKKNNRLFHGIAVYSWNEVKNNLKGKLIVIAAERAAYNEISHILNAEGFKEYIDYISDDLFDKEIVLLYGNCHMIAIAKYLAINPIFCSKFSILIQFVFDPFVITDGVLANIKYLISQDIRKGNAYNGLSVDELEEKISSNAFKIRIPNLYGLFSFFPQGKSSIYQDEYINHYAKDAIDLELVVDDISKKNSMAIVNNFCGIDENIDKLYKNGADIYEMERSMLYEDMYSDIKENFMLDMEKISAREKLCTIHITDFIKANYKEKKIFNDQNHPSNEIMIQFGRRILTAMNISIIELYPTTEVLDQKEVFIYGCVKRAMGMTFDQKLIRNKAVQNTFWKRPLTRYDYIRQYVIWNWGVDLGNAT
jgi:hypothetical protein